MNLSFDRGRVCLLSLLVVSCALSTRVVAESPPREPPNVLFIAIDDLNDWIGCLNGHPQVKTPNIDRLARRGTLFTNAHCQSPLCNSSRTSLLTGKRPSTTGIYGLGPWVRGVEDFADVVSLPQYFSAHGYRTFTGGKICHGAIGPKKLSVEFDVVGPGSGPGKMPKAKLVNSASTNPWVDWGVFDHKDEEKQDYRVATWAVDALAKEHQQPFFLCAGFFLPHVPCYATQKWFDLYPEKELTLPPILDDDRSDTPRFSWYLHWELPEPRLNWLREVGQHKNLVRSYLACISFVDHQVGRLLDALDASEHADNTIVVLWSDHGWHLGEKQITGKNTLWERSTRVPLLFAGPGVEADAKCDSPAELLDIFNTLVELCGLPANADLEGVSLVPQLRDSAAIRERPAITTHNHDNHAIVSQRWRYITYADGSEELYDHQSDPHEWTNVANDVQFAGIIAEHRKWVPKVNRKPATGSHSRILTYEKNEIIWEGKEILPEAAIPGLQ